MAFHLKIPKFSSFSLFFFLTHVLLQSFINAINVKKENQIEMSYI
jgi:hypothetical protein